MLILCLQHESFIEPSSLTDSSLTYGHPLRSHPLFEEGEIPSIEDFDCSFIMGCPMNICEEAKCPWLAPEKAFIRKAIAMGKYVIGICLIGQLFA